MFLVSLLLWMMVDIKEDIINNATSVQKKVEIHNINFYGFHDKKKVFSVHALSAWSGDDIDEAYLSDIVDGKIFALDGRILFQDLKAKKVYSNARYDSVFAENGISALFMSSAYAEEKSKQDKILIEAEQLKYDSFRKMTYIENNIKLTNAKTDIVADRAEIENEKNRATFFGNIILSNDDVVITANRLISYLDEERNIVTGGVTLYWLAEPSRNATDSRKAEIRSKETKITCQEMFYNKKKDEEFITFNYNIKVVQNNKILYGDMAFYNGKEKKFYLYGNVKIELTSLEWLLKDQTKKKLKDKESKEAIKEKTYITGDELVFNRDNNDIIIRGDVHVDQPKNEAFAGIVNYTDKNEQFTLLEAVKIRKKGKDWIDSEEAKMFLQEEVFEAMRRVVTEFTITKKK